VSDGSEEKEKRRGGRRTTYPRKEGGGEGEKKKIVRGARPWKKEEKRIFSLFRGRQQDPDLGTGRGPREKERRLILTQGEKKGKKDSSHLEEKRGNKKAVS